MRRLIIAFVALALVATAAPVFALNSGTDIIVPAAARVSGWFTDLYVANPGDTTVNICLVLSKLCAPRPSTIFAQTL